jgi:exonuclease III
LPGDPDDSHSRHIEAAVDGLLVRCLYLANGNPLPGPKFGYKLTWFKRLPEHAKGLLNRRADEVDDFGFAEREGVSMPDRLNASRPISR